MNLQPLSDIILKLYTNMQSLAKKRGCFPYRIIEPYSNSGQYACTNPDEPNSRIVINVNEFDKILIDNPKVAFIGHEMASIFLDVVKHSKYPCFWHRLVEKDRWIDVGIRFWLLRMSESRDEVVYPSLQRLTDWCEIKEMSSVSTIIEKVFWKLCDTLHNRSSIAYTEQCGWMSSGIQMRAWIALESFKRRGLNVDRSNIQHVMNTKLAEAQNLLHRFLPVLSKTADSSFKVGDTLLEYDEVGNCDIEWMDEPVKPVITNKHLKEALHERLYAIATARSLPLVLKDGEGTIIEKPLTTFEKWTSQFAEPETKWINDWIKYERLVQAIASIRNLLDSTWENGMIHPDFNLITRTGRVSMFNPSYQSTPRGSGVRELYTPRPGHVFVTMDFKYIELCTLAQICHANYKHSTMAKVIKDGIDPHSFTAAKIANMEFAEFLSQKTSNPKLFDNTRQLGKVVNMGIALGMGAETLRNKIVIDRGDTNMEVEDCKQLLNEMRHEVYPEIAEYHNHDMALLAMANALNVKVHAMAGYIKKRWPYSIHQRSIRSCFDGSKTIDQPPGNFTYGSSPKERLERWKQFYTVMWKCAKVFSKGHPQIRLLIEGSYLVGSEALVTLLVPRYGILHSGRLHYAETASQKRACEVSGLAADGAKLCLWELYKAGYHVPLFIHDEFVVEIPETSSKTYDTEVNHLRTLVETTMNTVTPHVPIRTDIAVSYMWSKKNDETRDENGLLIACQK